MVAVSGTRLDSLSVVSSGNSCVFRPVADRAKLFNEANIGKEYKMFCPITVDLKTNDIVVIDSVQYGVAGISNYQDILTGEDTHVEVVIVKKNT